MIKYNSKKINVLIHLTDDYRSTKKTHNMSDYTGFCWDIYQKIKNNLSDKYEFIEYFEYTDNYKKMINDVYNNKYDLVIAGFVHTEEGESMVNYTETIILTENSILHFNKTSPLKLLFSITKSHIKPIFVLLILGIILGFILNYFEPNRFKKSRSKKIYSIRRTILTVIASLFGEAGFLAENSTLKLKGVIFTILIMIIAFGFVLYLQAIVTDRVIEINKHDEINRENIKNHTILSPKGYPVSNMLQKFGAKIKYMDKSLPEVIDYYIKNPESGDGVAIDYFNALYYQQPSKGLIISDSFFGHEQFSFIVNKNNTELLEDLNNIIMKLRENLEPLRICKKYFDLKKRSLCII